jgi:hypothetical protein
MSAGLPKAVEKTAHGALENAKAFPTFPQHGDGSTMVFAAV